MVRLPDRPVKFKRLTITLWYKRRRLLKCLLTLIWVVVVTLYQIQDIIFFAREFKSSEKYFIRIRNLDKEQALNVSIAIYTVSCHFWDRQKQIWDTFGCKPQVVSDLKVVSCKCSHLTSFASAFKIAPNPIRWSTLEVSGYVFFLPLHTS